MPQFLPSTFPSQIFWLVVTLLVLFIVMSRFAIPRISEILEKRQRMIDDDLEQAERLKGQTEAAIAVYETALAEARQQAQASIRSVTETANREAERRNAELSRRLEEELKAGEGRIDQLRQDALASVRSVATDVSPEIASRLAGLSKVDAPRVQKAVDAAMKEGAQ